MNGPSDSFEDSSWDSLAIDLGLEPATPSKSPKTPAVELPKPTPVPRKSEPKRPHEPEAAAEEFGDIAEEKLPIVHPAKPVQPDVEVDDFDPTGEDTVLDEVLESDDDGGSLDESAGPGETTDGQVAGKKRRRRRRRKKSGGEATPASPAMAAEEKKAPAPPVAKAPRIVVPEEDDILVGDAAEEIESDDDDSEGEAPALLAEDLQDSSTEPLPDWKVVAWTDLIATLHRA